MNASSLSQRVDRRQLRVLRCNSAAVHTCRSRSRSGMQCAECKVQTPQYGTTAAPGRMNTTLCQMSIVHTLTLRGLMIKHASISILVLVLQTEIIPGHALCRHAMSCLSIFPPSLVHPSHLVIVLTTSQRQAAICSNGLSLALVYTVHGSTLDP